MLINRWSGLICALFATAAIAAVPPTTMLAPSGVNSTELMELSQRNDVTAFVYTVDRRMRRLTLDGTGAGTLGGQDLDTSPGADATLRIPFDQVALVYFRAGGNPERKVFPSLPAVGAAEQAMGCEALDVELRRTETIRWWARVPGAAPFTTQDIKRQPAHTAVLVAGAIVAWPLWLDGDIRGNKLPVDFNVYRWAMTAADRRELGLLRLKHDRGCEAHSIGKDNGSDMTILAGVDDSVHALEAKHITEDEQMAQQTRWLDRLYPSPPKPAKMSLSQGVQYEVEWRSNVDVEHHPVKALGAKVLTGRLQVSEDGLQFSGRPLFGNHPDTELRVPYTDLIDASLVQIGYWQGIMLRYADGHEDLLGIFTDKFVDARLTQAVRDQVKARLPEGP